jgi:hypothetical protein
MYIIPFSAVDVSQLIAQNKDHFQVYAWSLEMLAWQVHMDVGVPNVEMNREVV